MAGIAAMGDLSHELETLVIQIDGGSVVGDDHAHTIVQASLDELARMRDIVSNGALPPAAAALIAQIRRLAAPTQSAPATLSAPLSSAAAAAPMASRPASAPEAAPATAPVAVPVAAPAAAPPPMLRPAFAPSVDAPPAAGAVRAAMKEEPVAPAASEDSVPSLELSSAPVLPGRETAPAERVEMARVDADLLDTMLNNAGEVSIFRARLDQQVNSIDFNLAELARTVTRLKEQLRGLEIETEAQVLNRHQDADPRRTESAHPAVACHHRAAEQLDANAHGALPAPRAAADPPGAPGGE